MSAQSTVGLSNQTANCYYCGTPGKVVAFTRCKRPIGLYCNCILNNPTRRCNDSHCQACNPATALCGITSDMPYLTFGRVMHWLIIGLWLIIVVWIIWVLL